MSLGFLCDERGRMSASALESEAIPSLQSVCFELVLHECVDHLHSVRRLAPAGRRQERKKATGTSSQTWELEEPKKYGPSEQRLGPATGSSDSAAQTVRVAVPPAPPVPPKEEEKKTNKTISTSSSSADKLDKAQQLPPEVQALVDVLPVHGRQALALSLLHQGLLTPQVCLSLYRRAEDATSLLLSRWQHWCTLSGVAAPHDCRDVTRTLLRHCRSLTDVDLSHNGFVDPGFVDELASRHRGLVRVNLKGTKTVDSNVVSLLPLPRIHTLVLASCRVGTSTWALSCSSPSALRHLDVSGCRSIWKNPKNLYSLTNLEDLNVCSTRLVNLPAGIGGLVRLTALDLSCNDLAAIPGEIGRLQALEHLKVNGNKLSSLPRELASLSRLKVLNVRGNRLTNLPPELADLQALEDFDLSYNSLQQLPACLQRGPPCWVRLRRLSLEYNCLSRVLFPRHLRAIHEFRGGFQQAT